MFDYLYGKVADLLPTKVVLDVNGIGFDINISLNTFTALQDCQQAKLFIYESIREDAWVLFGFASQEERSLFLLLTGVSGIGGNTARTILSSIDPTSLCQAISNGDERLLTGVKGIGKRTAQRIIVELKDKIPASMVAITDAYTPIKPTIRDAVAEEKINEAIQALTMLGFAPAPSKKMVCALLDQHPEMTTEDLIKKAFTAI